MSSTSKIYRYPSDLEVKFPEGLDEIRFLREKDGFNYLSVKNSSENPIALPLEFEEAVFPEELLEAERQKRYLEAELIRKERQFQTITHGDISFSASQMARQNMLGVIEIIRNSPSHETRYWQDLSKETHHLNCEDFRSILNAISLRDTALYYVEAEIRKIIQSSSDINFLEGLNIKNLWDEQEQKYNESQEAEATQNQ